MIEYDELPDDWSNWDFVIDNDFGMTIAHYLAIFDHTKVPKKIL